MDFHVIDTIVYRESRLDPLFQEHFNKLKFNFIELKTKKNFVDQLMSVTPENWVEIQPASNLYFLLYSVSQYHFPLPARQALSSRMKRAQ